MARSLSKLWHGLPTVPPTRDAPSSRRLDLAVIVAVAIAGVVQVAVNQVVHVVAVGDRLVSAARPMTVALVVAFACVLGRAFGRVCRPDFQLVLLDAGLAHVVQVAIVQVIDMTVVLNGCVPAAGTMPMRMAGMSM